MKRPYLLITCLALTASSHALVFDTFSNGTFSHTVSSGSWVGSQSAGLGDERDSGVLLTANNFGGDATIAVSGGYFTMSGGPGISAKVGLDYDGIGDETDDSAPFEVGPGFAPRDLTAEGDTIGVHFGANDLALHMVTLVYSAGGGSSSWETTVDPGTNFTQKALYSDFMGTADFTKVDRVVFIFDTAQGGDFAVNSIDTLTTVPEPATMAILGVGILPLLRRRRRRS